MSEIEVLNTDRLEDWREAYGELEGATVYSKPEYVNLLEGNFEYTDEQAELFVLRYDDRSVYYPYFKRSLGNLSFADNADMNISQYYDIVSSWYWGGPILSDGADPDLALTFKNEFTEYCRANDIVSEFVRFDHSIGNHEWFSCLDPEFDRYTVTVDLTKSEDTIWEEYTSSNRTLIRQAQDTDLVVEPSSSADDYRDFHDIYSNAMDAKDASDHYRFSYEFFETLLSEHDDMSSFLVARYEDEVVGGFIIVHDRKKAHAYLRASNPDYWDMRVNNLLCHEALLYMKEAGMEFFDFQGGREGVFRFKKKFSEDRGEFHIARRVHMEETYEQLLEAARDSGIDTDKDYFPQYRIPKSN